MFCLMKTAAYFLSVFSILVFGGLVLGQDEKIQKDFAPLSFKRPEIDEFSIRPSVTWAGEKNPNNATAAFYIAEYGRSGRIAVREMYIVLKPEQLKELHERIGEMRKAIEGN